MKNISSTKKFIRYICLSTDSNYDKICIPTTRYNLDKFDANDFKNTNIDDIKGYPIILKFNCGTSPDFTTTSLYNKIILYQKYTGSYSFDSILYALIKFDKECYKKCFLHDGSQQELCGVNVYEIDDPILSDDFERYTGTKRVKILSSRYNS